MHHVQNILSGRSDRIKFTGVARHDQRHLIARAHMVGRTTRNSPTRIGMWNVVPHQQYGIKNNGPKQPTSPVSSHGSKSTLVDVVRDQAMEGPPQDVWRSMSVARAGCRKISLSRASHQSFLLLGRFQESEWALNGACPKLLMPWSV